MLVVSWIRQKYVLLLWSSNTYWADREGHIENLDNIVLDAADLLKSFDNQLLLTCTLYFTFFQMKDIPSLPWRDTVCVYVLHIIFKHRASTKPHDPVVIYAVANAVHVVW